MRNKWEGRLVEEISRKDREKERDAARRGKQRAREELLAPTPKEQWDDLFRKKMSAGSFRPGQ